MNVHYWPAIPLAALTAIVVAYVLYTEQRAGTTNPLEPWFNADDLTDYRPTAWDQAIGKDPRRTNA